MSNFILEFRNALAPDYCDQLIQKFEKFPHKEDGRTGAGVDKEKKDSLDCFISNHQEWQNDCNILAQAVLNATVEYAKRFPFLVTGAVSTGILDPKTKLTRTLSHEDIGALNNQQIQGIIKTIFRLDSINMQRYTKGKGGYHHWHSEHFPHPSEPTQKSLHRVLLWLVYLNDIEEGGETEFFYQKAKVKPKKGSLVLAPVNFTYTHRGCVPISSDKYVLASWLLYNEASQLYAVPKT
ncbi:MAG: 2OG-Fe(II) oxygenase [Kangiellaceae bacterium]